MAGLGFSLVMVWGDDGERLSLCRQVPFGN